MSGNLLFGVVTGDSVDHANRGARAVRIDQSTRAVMTIDYSHHEIHMGSLFILNTYSDNLASAATINIVLTTPSSGDEMRMIMEAYSSLAGTFEMYESPTVTAGSGSPAIPLNHNFNSSSTSGATCRTGMTVTGDGTLKYRRRLDYGVREGLNDRGVNEYILKFNTTYLFRLTSHANSNVATIFLTWYEHTPRD